MIDVRPISDEARDRCDDPTSAANAILSLGIPLIGRMESNILAKHKFVVKELIRDGYQEEWIDKDFVSRILGEREADSLFENLSKLKELWEGFDDLSWDTMFTDIA